MTKVSGNSEIWENLVLRLFPDHRLSDRRFPDRPFPDHIQLPRPKHRYLHLSQPTVTPTSKLFEWFKVEHISLWTGRGMCISLCRSGNMPISMLCSVLVLGRGTDGRTNNDREKDVVPFFFFFHFLFHLTLKITLLFWETQALKQFHCSWFITLFRWTKMNTIFWSAPGTSKFYV